MTKQMMSIRLEQEVRDLIRALSQRSDKEFGTHLSQAQVVEMAVRKLAKEEER